MAVAHIGFETIFAFAIYSHNTHQVLLETATTDQREAEDQARKLRMFASGQYSVVSLVVQEGGSFF